MGYLSTRRPGLDTLRGMTLVSMMVYHACWDLVYLFRQDWAWYRSFGAHLWQQSICWTFILLSGYCFHLGHHRLRHGLLSLGGGALVSAVSQVAGSPIHWGVLTLLGAAALLTIPLDPLLRRLPARAGLAGSFCLFFLLREVNQGYLGFEGAALLTLPADWYQNSLTALLGFPGPDFFSADYFSLLPWLFLFWTGYFLYRLRPEGEGREPRLPLVTTLGRHSLVAYLLHQPLIYGVLWMFARVS
uniref:heparan-alpha-glucosaminide N-acetyltransferase domain-containing protein n=1 Tax=Dysosmobacter welbionis TaxID=2093857 RepID=UPI0023F29011|nr:heparan-alpha-glucosaminide N-acetyltransferase domain-containing protein [Dysosmobacter welbionis]